MASEVLFPIGYGVTRDIANTLGAWWEDRRNIIQPSEFIVGMDNKIIVSSYSDGPLGRIEGGRCGEIDPTLQNPERANDQA